MVSCPFYSSVAFRVTGHHENLQIELAFPRAQQIFDGGLGQYSQGVVYDKSMGPCSSAKHLANANR